MNVTANALAIFLNVLITGTGVSQTVAGQWLIACEGDFPAEGVYVPAADRYIHRAEAMDLARGRVHVDPVELIDSADEYDRIYNRQLDLAS